MGTGTAAGFVFFLLLASAPVFQSRRRRLHKFSHFIISIWPKQVNFIISGSGALEKLLIWPHLCKWQQEKQNPEMPKMTAISRLQNKVKVFNLLFHLATKQQSKKYIANSAFHCRKLAGRHSFNCRLINETQATDFPRKSPWEKLAAVVAAAPFPQRVKMSVALGEAKLKYLTITHGLNAKRKYFD